MPSPPTNPSFTGVPTGPRRIIAARKQKQVSGIRDGARPYPSGPRRLRRQKRQGSPKPSPTPTTTLQQGIPASGNDDSLEPGEIVESPCLESFNSRVDANLPLPYSPQAYQFPAHGLTPADYELSSNLNSSPVDFYAAALGFSTAAFALSTALMHSSQVMAGNLPLARPPNSSQVQTSNSSEKVKRGSNNRSSDSTTSTLIGSDDGACWVGKSPPNDSFQGHHDPSTQPTARVTSREFEDQDDFIPL